MVHLSVVIVLKTALMHFQAQWFLFIAIQEIVCHLFPADPKTHCFGSFITAPARCGPRTQDVAVHSAAQDAICGVMPLPRDRPLTTRNRRCGARSAVSHFRKVVYRQKVGSPENRERVIEWRGYMLANYHKRKIS